MCVCVCVLPPPPPPLLLQQVKSVAVALAAPGCAGGTSLVDTFDYNGTAWAACEDLQQPGGDIVLVSSSGVTERFTKGYAQFTTNWTDNKDFYLGLTKVAATP